MLFSHGVESVGLPPIERWRVILRERGSFVGVAEDEFPRDYASSVRYHTGLKRIPSRFPMPESLPLDRLDAFPEQTGERYPVRWL